MMEEINWILGKDEGNFYGQCCKRAAEEIEMLIILWIAKKEVKKPQLSKLKYVH